MKKIIEKIVNAITSHIEPRGCMNGTHAQLELIHTDSYGKMMFYCRQCGRSEHY